MSAHKYYRVIRYVNPYSYYMHFAYLKLNTSSGTVMNDISKLTVSSTFNDDTNNFNKDVMINPVDGKEWMSKRQDYMPFMQYEFSKNEEVSSVTVQNKSSGGECIAIILQYSDDGNNWNYYGFCWFNVQINDGNRHTAIVRKNRFTEDHKFWRLTNIQNLSRITNIYFYGYKNNDNIVESKYVASKQKNNGNWLSADYDSYIGWAHSDYIQYEFDVADTLLYVHLTDSDASNADVYYSDDGINWTLFRENVGIHKKNLLIFNNDAKISKTNINNIEKYTTITNNANIKVSIARKIHSTKNLQYQKLSLLPEVPTFNKTFTITVNRYKINTLTHSDNRMINKKILLIIDGNITDEVFVGDNGVATFKVYNTHKNYQIKDKINGKIIYDSSLAGNTTYTGFIEGALTPTNFALKSGDVYVAENTTIDYTFNNLKSDVEYYLHYNETCTKLDITQTMVKGSISGSVSITDCVDSEFYIKCIRDDGFYIGRYEIVNNAYTIPNLNKNTSYDIILVDTNKKVESLIHSRRVPI